MRSYWTKVGPKPMTDIFTGERDLETHRKKGHVRMEAGTGVMQLPAQKSQRLLGASRS